jgi:thiol-disulfide isomerase/thioredoxin
MCKFLILFFLILGAVGCGSKNPDADLISEGDRVTATEINANFIHSHKLNLAKLKGKVVILDFWATWCGPCRLEIPSFVKLYSLYHLKGLEIIGLSVEAQNSHPASYFDQFLKDFSINYPIGFAVDATIKAYAVEGYPTTCFVDKTGKIAKVFIGDRPEDEITGVVEKLLAE